jgi:hypothetical protein
MEFDFECQDKVKSLLSHLSRDFSLLGSRDRAIAAAHLRGPQFNGWRLDRYFGAVLSNRLRVHEEGLDVASEFEVSLSHWCSAGPRGGFVDLSQSEFAGLDNTEEFLSRFLQYRDMVVTRKLFELAVGGPVDYDKLRLAIFFIHRALGEGMLDMADEFCDELDASLTREGLPILTQKRFLAEVNLHRGDIKYARGDLKGAASCWRQYGLLGDAGSLFALLRAADALAEIDHIEEAEEVLRLAKELHGAFAFGPADEIRMKFGIVPGAEHGSDAFQTVATRQRVEELYRAVGLDCLANADDTGDIRSLIPSSAAVAR